MVYNTCNAPDAMHSLAHLDGAGHSQDQSSATSHGTRIPCLSNHIFGKGPCSSPVGLDVQLLRVCRQIYDEAILLPYAENHFIISTGFWSAFRAEFVAQFSREKRSSMNTVAVLGNLEEEIECVSDLLPGLKRLWFDIDFGSYHSGLSLAASQAKCVEAYSQIELPCLVGVTVRFTELNTRNEGIEERLELALLSRQAP